jgi:hypothetical protein
VSTAPLRRWGAWVSALLVAHGRFSLDRAGDFLSPEAFVTDAVDYEDHIGYVRIRL